MSKKELFIDMWIPLEKRSPCTEKDKLQEVLLYHEKTHEIHTTYVPYLENMIKYMKELKDGTRKRPNGQICGATEFTHWMPVYAPRGMESVYDVIHRDKREGTELWRQNLQRWRTRTDD